MSKKPGFHIKAFPKYKKGCWPQYTPERGILMEPDNLLKTY